MIIHDVNPQLQQAELFLEQLFHQLAAKERVEVRSKLRLCRVLGENGSERAEAAFGGAARSAIATLRYR